MRSVRAAFLFVTLGALLCSSPSIAAEARAGGLACPGGEPGTLLPEAPQCAEPGEGPSAIPSEPGWSIEAPSEKSPGDRFVDRIDVVKWEVGATAAVITLANLPLILREPQSFRFKSEEFFGRGNPSRGVDKMAHAWHGYVFSDILYQRMSRRTGGGRESAYAAAALGLGLQTLGEVYDGFHEGSGFSLEDSLFNLAGAGFSVMRHTVPGLKEKVDFRLMIVPNSSVFTFRGKRHFGQQHYILALKAAGFDRFRNSPLRFAELHVGYHVEDLAASARDPTIVPRPKPFVGIGLNVAELFLKKRRGTASGVGRAALQYLQVPYTAVHID